MKFKPLSTQQRAPAHQPPGYSSGRGLGSTTARFESIRAQSMAIIEPLEPEDCLVQSMPDASPLKWHLAHTTWFFETFILRPHAPRYRPTDERYAVLFNSYYNAVGEQWPREKRGLLARPTLAQVLAYRDRVDAAVVALLNKADDAQNAQLAPLIDLGLNHEQQHQELMLTDLQHALFGGGIQPTYQQPTRRDGRGEHARPVRWLGYEGGVVEIGRREQPGFSFDNEQPRHRALLQDFALADRPVTCREFLAFIEDGGYERHELWLDAGWQAVQQNQWRAPLYWQKDGNRWRRFSLQGWGEIELDAPVCHVSFFEADAFARWAGARLPTEQEWEHAAADVPVAGNFLEERELAPRPADPPRQGQPRQLFGDVWEWTASPYRPYPGYRAQPGAIGEYNGKFMCGQFVLRGGSCASPRSHLRATYRNFWAPATRWQFAGFRLARDA